MAESTLSLTYDDLAAEIGYFLGLGRKTVATWSAGDLVKIDAIIQAGYRRFLLANDWSFLSPMGSLVTVAGTSDYTAPDDFGGLTGDMTYASTDYGPGRVEIRGEGFVRDLRQRSSGVTGFPRYAAVQPKAGTGTTGQRDWILLFPTPSAVYTLSYPYIAYQGKLATTKYPLGGMNHAETLKAVMLEAADEMENSQIGGTASIRAKELLQQSILRDNTAMRPRNHGQNLNGGTGARNFMPNRNVTYNGVQYE